MRPAPAMTVLGLCNAPQNSTKKQTGVKYVQSIRRIHHNVMCCRPVERTKLTSSEVQSKKYRPRPRCLGGRFGLEGRLRQPCQGWLQCQHRPRAGDVLPG